MTSFFLFIFALLCLLVFIWSTLKNERMIQIPFLMCAVFLGWVLPQLFGLNEQNYLPSGALEKVIIMSALCLLATWLGYEANRKPARMLSWRFNQKRLLIGAAFLTLLGAFFFFKVSQFAEIANAETGGRWTGIITIYVFFANLLSFGTAIALVLFIRRKDIFSFIVLLPGLLLYMDRILIKGRRAAMVELSLMVILAIWFNRRLLPPRWMMLSVIVVGALVVNSIGDYRSVMLGSDSNGWSGAGFSQVLEIDFVGNLKRSFYGDGKNYELTNAAMDIAATDHELRFDFGLSLWNGFVHRYIPAQILGNDFKQAIRFEGGSDAGRAFGYYPHTGTTVTGMSDAYKSFWYFGAIKFFLIGLIMSRWYKAAVAGSVSAQLIVLLSMNNALHTVTHSTHHFFLNFVQLAIFLVPVLWFAKKKFTTSTL